MRRMSSGLFNGLWINFWAWGGWVAIALFINLKWTVDQVSLGFILGFLFTWLFGSFLVVYIIKKLYEGTEQKPH